MSLNLTWMQTGACSGDTLSLLCADRPSLERLLKQHDIRLLWHPSLTSESRVGPVLESLLERREPLDILCIEGSLMTGPDGSGLHDTWKGTPKVEIVRRLAELARHVVAVGTCAAFGGVHAAPLNPTDCTGLPRTADPGAVQHGALDRTAQQDPGGRAWPRLHIAPFPGKHVSHVRNI